MEKIDNIEPKKHWEFDEDVADVFDDMLSRSIPQYDLMRNSVENLIAQTLENKEVFNVLDIGCSNGIMLDSLVKRLSNKNCGHYIGIDVSEPMLNKAKVRLLDDIICGKVKIENLDLRTNFPNTIFDVITSILTIQFTPIEYRQHIIQNIYNHMNSGGVFIMVEKVLGNTDKLNEIMINQYYNMKTTNGYTQEQIDRKRLSLEGVLVPVTNDWNIDLLKQSGFKQVDVFWRWMNFVGYIAIR